MRRTFRRSAVVASLAAVVAATVGLTLAQPAGSESVVKVTGRIERSAEGKTFDFVVHFAIDKPWHIYANPVGNDEYEPYRTTVEIVGKTKPKSVRIDYPAGTSYEEDGVKLKVYQGEVEVRAVLELEPGAASPLEAVVRFGACKDKTCLTRANLRIPVK